MNPDNPSFRTHEEEQRAAELVRVKLENEELKRVIEIQREIFNSHLSTMDDINAHMGYKFSQPLIAAREKMSKAEAILNGKKQVIFKPDKMTVINKETGEILLETREFTMTRKEEGEE